MSKGARESGAKSDSNSAAPAPKTGTALGMLGGYSDSEGSDGSSS
jgi:hypothetical protein